MGADDRQVARAACTRGFDIVQASNLGRDALGDARERRYEHDGQGDDGIDYPGAEGPGNRDRQQDRRKGVEHVDRPHDRHVQLAADEAGKKTQGAADEQRENDRRDSHEKRQPSSVQQPREHVPAKLVAAEREPFRADRLQAFQHARLVGARRRQRIGEHRGQDDRDQDDAAGDGDLVVFQAVADGLPVAPRLDGHLRGIDAGLRDLLHGFQG